MRNYLNKPGRNWRGTKSSLLFAGNPLSRKRIILALLRHLIPSGFFAARKFLAFDIVVARVIVINVIAVYTSWIADRNEIGDSGSHKGGRGARSETHPAGASRRYGGRYKPATKSSVCDTLIIGRIYGVYTVAPGTRVHIYIYTYIYVCIHRGVARV